MEEAMNRINFLVVTSLALATLPQDAYANCVSAGQLSRVSINPGTAISSFFVTTSTPAQPSFLYTTNDVRILGGVDAAEISHMTVQVTGNATSCPSAVGGIVHGGTVVTFTLAP
jgi:hypothetical protein